MKEKRFKPKGKIMVFQKKALNQHVTSIAQYYAMSLISKQSILIATFKHYFLIK